jgi:hypothetical protein
LKFAYGKRVEVNIFLVEAFGFFLQFPLAKGKKKYKRSLKTSEKENIRPNFVEFFLIFVCSLLMRRNKTKLEAPF